MMHTLHIFGGGPLTAIAEKIALKEGWRVVVRTGRRFATSLPRFDVATPVHLGDDLHALMRAGGLPAAGDIGLSFSAPWIVPQDVIDLFSGEIFNLHAQPLPKFRGGGGASWLILMGAREGGCCIHRLVRRVDAGAIYARRDFRFPEGCRFPEDFDRHMMAESGALVTAWLPGLLRSGETGPELPVSEAESEYWPRLNTDIHGWIDWSWPLRDVVAFCDAFSYPFPGAQTLLRGAVVRLRNVRMLADTGKFHPFQRGMIFRIDGGLAVAHPDGTLIVEDYEVEEPGLRIVLGDRLYTPAETLHAAMTRRIQYRPSGEIVEN